MSKERAPVLHFIQRLLVKTNVSFCLHKSTSMHFLSVGRQSPFDLKTKASHDFLMRSTSSNSVVTALESTFC